MTIEMQRDLREYCVGSDDLFTITATGNSSKVIVPFRGIVTRFLYNATNVGGVDAIQSVEIWLNDLPGPSAAVLIPITAIDTGGVLDLDQELQANPGDAIMARVDQGTPDATSGIIAFGFIIRRN